MAGRKSTTDLTIGNPLKVTLLFALPLFLSNICQQIYNLSDIAIIGHALGDNALSAIGSVSTIYGFFNSFYFGMASGFGVVISKYYGAKNPDQLRKAVANTGFIAILWSLIITTIGLISLKPLMRVLHTPDSIFDMAYSYAVIVIGLSFFLFMYNVLSGMLRSIGNSKAPLYFLMISVSLNLLLNYSFVVKLGMGLPGAAIATAISQFVSSALTVIYIIKYVPELHLKKEDLSLNRNMLSDIFTSGIAFALMYTVVNLGTMILQSAINGFGPTTIAAHTTARKISEMCMMTVSTLANAMATFAGQNHGARRYDRIKEGLKKVMLFSFCFDTVLIAVIYTFGNMMVRGISGTSTQELIDTATFYLKVDLPFYYVLSIILITRTTLQGIGARFVPIIASVMELLFKAFTAGYLALKLGYLGIAICEPVTWVICAAFILSVFLVEIKKLGKLQAQLESSGEIVRE